MLLTDLIYKINKLLREKYVRYIFLYIKYLRQISDMNCLNNQYIAGDTWIATNLGYFQANQLTEKSFRIISEGIEYEVLSDGFINIGKKTIVRNNNIKRIQSESIAKSKYFSGGRMDFIMRYSAAK
jgi:hypothetical protein